MFNDDDYRWCDVAEQVSKQILAGSFQQHVVRETALHVSLPADTVFPVH